MSDLLHLPMSRAEMIERDWDELDVLLISGDAYVDHPSFGIALIGRVLEAAGYRVGIVAQPDWTEPSSVTTLGRPKLFVGISSGNVDSMVAHYTAARHKRNDDAYTENGKLEQRPNRALAVYSQLAKRAFKGIPIVIGGIEASMRRIAHYDYWQDKIRPSALTDCKADILVFGMGERPILEVAKRLSDGTGNLAGIRSTARLLGGRESATLDTESSVVLPSFEELTIDRNALRKTTKIIEREANPNTARRLIQFHGARALIVEPPSPTIDRIELDRIYSLPFTRLSHPSYSGKIPAWEMIKDSITVVRGCPGGCSFCSLGMHQGKFLTSRSQESICAEVTSLSKTPKFRGVVSDLGGPTANLYGCNNGTNDKCEKCERPSCLWPSICKYFKIDGTPGLKLLRAVRELPKVKRLFVNSGVRMEVLLRTPEYFDELIACHVSGHLKVAPEHLEENTLRRMRKCSAKIFHEFRKAFDDKSAKDGKEQYLVPYFIASFPGCSTKDMDVVKKFVKDEKWRLRQVQDFIPLPMTPAAAMYWAEVDYDTGDAIYVAKGTGARKKQRDQLQPHFKQTRARRK